MGINCYFFGKVNKLATFQFSKFPNKYLFFMFFSVQYLHFVFLFSILEYTIQHKCILIQVFAVLCRYFMQKNWRQHTAASLKMS